MPRPTRSDVDAMRADFAVACAFFRMGPEARDIAWRAAERNVRSAAPCYRAIVNSLGIMDLGAQRPMRAAGRRSSRSAP